jgi:hypothetical protein
MPACAESPRFARLDSRRKGKGFVYLDDDSGRSAPTTSPVARRW